MIEDTMRRRALMFQSCGFTRHYVARHGIRRRQRGILSCYHIAAWW